MGPLPTRAVLGPRLSQAAAVSVANENPGVEARWTTLPVRGGALSVEQGRAVKVSQTSDANVIDPAKG